MNTWHEYLVNKFKGMSDLELMRAMHKNVKLAMSFRRMWNEGTGDTWLAEAWDQSHALEARGYTVREDWAVINHNGERVF